MNGFKLLSEIYRLAAEADEAAIDRARRTADARELIVILDALRALHLRDPSPESNLVSDDGPSGRLSSPPNFREQLEYALRSNASDKSVALRLLRDVGVRFRVGPKDSYLEVVKKAARVLEKRDERARQKVLSALMPKSQTEGWMSVIRRG